MKDGSHRWLGAAVASLTTDVVCVIDAETGRFVEVNAAFERTLGYTPAEAQTLRFADVCRGAGVDLGAWFAELDAGGSSNAGLLPCRSKSGSVMPLATRASVARLDGKRVYC